MVACVAGSDSGLVGGFGKIGEKLLINRLRPRAGHQALQIRQILPGDYIAGPTDGQFAGCSGNVSLARGYFGPCVDPNRLTPTQFDHYI